MNTKNRFTLKGYRIISSRYAILHIPQTLKNRERIAFKIKEFKTDREGKTFLFGWTRFTKLKAIVCLTGQVGKSYIEYD